MITPMTRLRLAIGMKSYRVASLDDASRRYCDVREARGEGASRLPPGMIYDGPFLVAHVSYNGRVWAGHPRDWKADAKPLLEAQ